MRFAPLWRAVGEISLLVFLLYSIRLMGEFTFSNGQGKSLALALNNIFTGMIFLIAAVSALIGHFVLELIRKRL
jgi:hypothetical protein